MPVLKGVTLSAKLRGKDHRPQCIKALIHTSQELSAMFLHLFFVRAKILSAPSSSKQSQPLQLLHLPCQFLPCFALSPSHCPPFPTKNLSSSSEKCKKNNCELVLSLTNLFPFGRRWLKHTDYSVVFL